MKAYYINLDKRADRRAQIEEELKRLGIDAERFPAIETSPGIVGCSYSHHEVIKLARTNNEPYVMVLEDDFEATVPPDVFSQTIKRVMDDLNSDFDVLLLSYNLMSSAPYNNDLVKVLNSQTMSGYIVHQKFYDTLISLFDKTNPMLLNNPHLEYIYACDIAWKSLQPQHKWYAFTPRLGKQRASYSDNTRKFEDYGV